MTSHDPQPGRARPPGESPPTGTEPVGQARTKGKDAAAGEPRATGTHPRHALVLLAYAAANVIELVPVTPGGLGLVEASLGGLLVLAGVHGGDALLATLAYRLASYWLPLTAGLPAYFLYRHRYGRLEHRSRH